MLARHTRLELLVSWHHLISIAALLNDSRCWSFNDRFHFNLDPEGEWTIAVSGDSMGRLRIDTCHLGVERATKWLRANDGDRLAEVVRSARDEVTTAA
jgi:hypothetical protein